MNARGPAFLRLQTTAIVLAAALFAVAPNAFAKHHHHGLSGKGTITITNTAPCATGSDTCFDVNCNFPPGHHGVSATCAGSGMTDPTSCKVKGRRSCCDTTMNLNFSLYDQNSNELGTFFAGFVGLICEKPASNPTVEILKGMLAASDGTGIFNGETGGGRMSAKIDPSTGEGPVKARVHTK